MSSTSSVTTGIAQEYNYNDFATPSANTSYIRVTPSNNNDLTIGAGQSVDVTIDTPSTRCWIPARSYAKYTYSLTYGIANSTTGGVNTCIALSVKSVPFFANARWQPEKGTLAVTDTNGHAQDIANIVAPYVIPFDEFKQRDSTTQSMFPCPFDSGTTNSLITGSAKPNWSKYEPQYVQSLFRAQTSAHVATTSALTSQPAKALFKDIAPLQPLSVDKVVPPARTGGQITFTIGFPERHILVAQGSGVTSRATWQGADITNTDYAGTLTITGLEFYFAVEDDHSIENQLMQRVATTGWKLNVPYTYYRALPLTSRVNHQITYSVEPMMGHELKTVFTAPLPNPPTRTAWMFDNNNMSASSVYASSTTSSFVSGTATTAKISKYVTAVEGSRTTQFDLDVENKDDYLLNKKYLGDSVIQDSLQYLQNWAIIDDFSKGITFKNPCAQGGLPLGNKSLTYQVDAVTKDTGGTAYNWGQVYVYGRTMVFGPSGVAFV